jgi:hypothetical protein
MAKVRFAISRPFQRLRRRVQDELLKKSTPVYIQMMLGFYLTTTLGSIKLREILCLFPHERISTIVELNMEVNLFKSSAGELHSLQRPGLS